MADYPFRVNMRSKNGIDEVAFMTASLVTDADALVSASIMVEKINLMPSASYDNGVVSGSSTEFVQKFGGNRNKYLSCSVSDPNAGTISFIDTETTDNGGLDNYTFWGTKVCSVLGLPEGIPIYTENFKLSDSSTDPDNYLSGTVIADAVSIKSNFKLSPQARVRSNLVWDEEFGEGLVQWVSGSSTQLRMGYDNVNDVYSIRGNGFTQMLGFGEIGTAGGAIRSGSFLRLDAADIDMKAGASKLTIGETNSAAITIGDGFGVTGAAHTLGKGNVAGVFIGSQNTVKMTAGPGDGSDTIVATTTSGLELTNGRAIFEFTNTTTFANTATDSLFQLVLRNNTDTTNAFVGIAFQAEAGFNTDRINAAIFAERVDSGASDVNSDLVFAVNNDADDDLFERMRLSTDGVIFLENMAAGVDNSVVIYDADGGLRTDEIDSRVWGTTLLDGTNGSNNEIAIFTDSNSVEGVTTLTYDNQTLSVGVGDSLPRLFLDSTSSGDNWTAQGAHISLGETAGENASLSLTYTGDGYGRIGMGDITSGVPAFGEIKFTYNTDVIQIPSAHIGMGIATPSADFHIFQDSGASQQAFKIYGSGDRTAALVKFNHSEATLDTGETILDLDFDDDQSIGSSNYYIYFQNQDGQVGSVNSEVLYTTFTGGHISQKPSGSDFSDWKPGMIVKSTGEIIELPGSASGSLSMAWPIVDLTTSQKDKAVMGVFNSLDSAPVTRDGYVTGSKNPLHGRVYGLDDNAPSIVYNAVGEGKLLVTDTNGNIETGDYICSSVRDGHGEKQDDDILHNYTVAKATQPMDFSTKSADSDLGYKSVLIACTYHCG